MLQLRTAAGQPLEIEVANLVVAGWTGGNRAAVQKHIDELAAIGIPGPSTVPLFYRVAADRLTTATRCQFLGSDGAGEVEAVLLCSAGKLWVGVVSDHTARKVESYSIAVSKEMCAKPMGRVVWPYDEVAGHWDQLILRARAVIGGQRVLYQEGPTAKLLPPQELMAKWNPAGGRLRDGEAMLCGTLSAIGGVRPASRFEMELEDPVLGRTLSHAYDIEELPVVA